MKSALNLIVISLIGLALIGCGNDPLTYEFPETIDPTESYLFYLHGRIIEDQGLPAVSPEFGEYEYIAILEVLSDHGFEVVSEQRPKDTDGIAYARRISDQISTLLEAGVPAQNITIVGASKGAGIAIYASHFIQNPDVRYVIMGICHPNVVGNLMNEQIHLTGHVLSIYDFVDDWAGSCQKLFDFSEGKGLSSYDEVILEIGTGHGILYVPLDEWIDPSIRWARGEAP
jgi:hypothetical protein